MPPRKPPRRKTRGLSGSFIAMGILSLIYSGFLPLFRLFDYAGLALVMWLGGKIFRALVKNHYAAEDAEIEKQEAEENARREAEEAARRAEAEKKRRAEQSPRTGDQEVDALILKGQQLLYKIREENERLPDPVISEQIDTIESISNQIFRIVIEQPEKADQIRRFMDYYLPTTLKMLSAYRRMEENNATGEQARKAQEKIRQSLDTVIGAFRKHLSQLFEEDALDIATDIDVMETMLRQDGLIDSGLKVKTSTGEEK